MLFIERERRIHADLEHAAGDIDAPNLIVWEGEADERDLSGVAASMQTTHPEKPTPASVPAPAGQGRVGITQAQPWRPDRTLCQG